MSLLELCVGLYRACMCSEGGGRVNVMPWSPPPHHLPPSTPLPQPRQGWTIIIHIYLCPDWWFHRNSSQYTSKTTHTFNTAQGVHASPTFTHPSTAAVKKVIIHAHFPHISSIFLTHFTPHALSSYLITWRSTNPVNKKGGSERRKGYTAGHSPLTRPST